MFVFQCPWVAWQFQTPLLYSSATGPNPGMLSWGKLPYLTELDVRKPVVVWIPRKSEELGLNNLGENFTVSYPGLKVASSNASPGWTVRFFGNDDWEVFWKRESTVKAYLMAPMSPLNSPTFFCLHNYSLWDTPLFFFLPSEIWVKAYRLTLRSPLRFMCPWFVVSPTLDHDVFVVGLCVPFISNVLLSRIVRYSAGKRRSGAWCTASPSWTFSCSCCLAPSPTGCVGRFTSWYPSVLTTEYGCKQVTM